jgi:hypothetical protein
VLRQLGSDEIQRPLEPIAEVRVVVRTRLENLGVIFVEDDDPGLPSPSQTAAIELANGSQFAFEHFYAFEDCGLVVRATPGAVTPRERLAELQVELGFGADDVCVIHDAW